MEKNINITRHALMRYAARVYKAAGITDRTFDSWKKRHEEETKKLEEVLTLEFQAAEYITTAAYDGNKKAEFYIRRDLMMTYVVCCNKMLTCYYIDFGLDDIGNRDMLEVLSKNLQRALEDEENFEKKNEERIAEAKSIILIRNSQIVEEEAILEKLRNEKTIAESELKNLELEKRELQAVIHVAREKIVRSKKAM